MKRRVFLANSLAVGAGMSSFGAVTAAASQDSAQGGEPKASPLVEKVKTAMLSMQRAPWEQGVAAQALLEMGETDLVILMAKEAVLRQIPDGRLGMLYTEQAVTDPASNGEAVLAAGKLTGDPAFKQAADRMLEYLLTKAPKTADGTLHHNNDKPQVWSDAGYMAPPFLAVAGRPDEAVKQIEGFRRFLWNEEKKLYSHIWDDGKKAFERRDFWGVGNGWTAAGMARVIKALPPAMSQEKKRLAGYVRELVDACLTYQREDGLFHDVVDKPETFVETNLAQMLAYTIYRGIQGRWLDASYRTAADRMRRAATAKVDRFGLVQGVCGSPHFNRPGTATEGQAFFLLMEAAAEDKGSN